MCSFFSIFMFVHITSSSIFNLLSGLPPLPFFRDFYYLSCPNPALFLVFYHPILIKIFVSFVKYSHPSPPYISLLDKTAFLNHLLSKGGLVSTKIKGTRQKHKYRKKKTSTGCTKLNEMDGRFKRQRDCIYGSNGQGISLLFLCKIGQFMICNASINIG